MMETAQIFESQAAPSNVSTSWEDIAQLRWGSYMSDVERRAILKAHAMSPQPGEALEVGCDGGRWSKLLADLGWKMTCTDINPKTLNICQQRIPDARCVLTDPSASSLPCETASLGMIMCIEVPWVLPDGDWFLDEACRTLQPGGILVGSINNLASCRGVFHHTTATLRGVNDYYKFAYSSWRKMMRMRGFEFLHEEGYCWFPFKRVSNSPLVPALTAVEQYLGLRKAVAISPWIAFAARLNKREQGISN